MSDSTLRVLSNDEIDVVAGGISFDDAYNDFMEGGALLGGGAGSLIASAYTGIALTPALILGSLNSLLGSLGGLTGGVTGDLLS
ncbi:MULTISPECIES: hypothetical protein [Halomonas]|jgi:hypothetical protein|uniref:Bacteriocin n=1 Tax=Halomonas binhaiensis TaxID=2562282 RepID=A0A5C1NKJ6_9GAMM|nr:MULTISPECIES: hypothetical protein [Halomonas]QEM82349.1 hypothetical protein E4T21_12940 [Halomonas binhaiensis]